MTANIIPINRRCRVFIGRKYPAGVVTRILPERIAVIRCAACEKLKEVDARNLHKLKSCGCRKNSLIAAARTIHGGNRRHKRTTEYRIWAGLFQRCNNPNNQRFKTYGLAGIRVCERWTGPNGFQNFLADKGKRPKRTSLGRFGDVGDYSPENTAWQSPAEQAAEQKKKRAARLANERKAA
jgi:hypothetical protein